MMIDAILGHMNYAITKALRLEKTGSRFRFVISKDLHDVICVEGKNAISLSQRGDVTLFGVPATVDLRLEGIQWELEKIVDYQIYEVR